ncbi:MAG: Mth938-like domain-containing protein [Rhizobiales bacterium]|jgi:uncharacterized protein|nr:Mth938-like domain-containing protein [Hyphomicrobiales bacterium]
MAAAADSRPHLPRLVSIDGYGKGGFHFDDMSHRGSLLCLPSGIWTWPVTQAADIDEATLAQVFTEASEIGLFLLGTGRDRWIMPDALHDRFHALKINVEVARTGSAVSTYNILLGEGRRVAAALVAVE